MGESTAIVNSRVFSYSMLASWRRCRQKFHLTYRLGVEGKPSLGQARGSAGHAALCHYYSNDRNMDRAIDEAWKVYQEKSPGEVDQEDWELLERILIRYGTWAQVHDDFEVVSLEEHFEFELPGGHKLQGYIDGIVRYKGRVWLLEHKFNKQARTQHLDLDAQVSTYMLAAHLMDHEPVGVFYNIIRVADGPTAIQEPVVRKQIYRNPEGLWTFAWELVAQMEEAHAFLSNPEAPAYRNLTMDCSWDCPFTTVCLSINDTGSADAIINRLPRKERAENEYRE